MADGFPQPGEYCPSCKERWVKRKKRALPLTALPGLTQIYHSTVAICSYCDGPIYSIATAAARRRDESNSQ